LLGVAGDLLNDAEVLVDFLANGVNEIRGFGCTYHQMIDLICDSLGECGSIAPAALENEHRRQHVDCTG